MDITIATSTQIQAVFLGLELGASAALAFFSVLLLLSWTVNLWVGNIVAVGKRENIYD